MVSIISLKQKVFCDTKKCLFRCWINKLWSPTKIYLRAAPLPNIYKWLTTGIKRNWVIPLCWRYLYLLSRQGCWKIEIVLNKEFSSLFEWVIDNKLSIHLRDDKQKQFFFSRMKSPPQLNISSGDYSLKQHNTVEYLWSYLGSYLNGTSIARRCLKKINTKLSFLWRQGNYFNYSSRRLPCNALIHSYTASLWLSMHIMVSFFE